MQGETSCPSCGFELAEGSVIAGRKQLERENVSLCRNCAEILFLSETSSGLIVRAAKASEFLRLRDESQMLLRVAYELVKRPRRYSRIPSRHLN